MSFPKAKRFSETKSCTPSPADYTVLNNSNSTGAVIHKSERFAEINTPGKLDVTSSNLSASKTTKSLPKCESKVKKAVAILKPVELFHSKETLDALKDKIVECNNKDQYIMDLMDQVEEMKQELSSCNSQLSKLNLKHMQLTETLSSLNADKDILINNQQMDFETVNSKLLAVYNTHNSISDVKIINIEHKNNLSTVLDNINMINDLLESYKMNNDRNVDKLQEKDHQLFDLEEKYLNSQEEHTNKIDTIIQKYKEQIKNIEEKQNLTNRDFVKQLSDKKKLLDKTTKEFMKLQQNYELEKVETDKEHEEEIQQLILSFKEANVLAVKKFQETARKEREERDIQVEQELQLKVNQLKNESDAKIVILNQQLSDANLKLEDTLQQLEKQQSLNAKAQLLIENSLQEKQSLKQCTQCANTEDKYNLFQAKLLQLEQDNEELLTKVNQLKNESDAKIVILNQQLSDANLKLEDTLQQLEKQQSLNAKAQLLIENSLQEKQSLKQCTQCANTEDKYNLFQAKLLQLEQDNEELLTKIEEQESLIGPFRDQLMQYETEYKALSNQKYNAEKEAKEMGLKFAQLLGHQNQKQKIKHLMDLKMKNHELSETIKDLEAKNRQQARIIDKLQKESATTPKSAKKKNIYDKENMVTPSYLFEKGTRN